MSDAIEITVYWSPGLLLPLAVLFSYVLFKTFIEIWPF